MRVFLVDFILPTFLDDRLYGTIFSVLEFLNFEVGRRGSFILIFLSLFQYDQRYSVNHYREAKLPRPTFNAPRATILCVVVKGFIWWQPFHLSCAILSHLLSHHSLSSKKTMIR